MSKKCNHFYGSIVFLVVRLLPTIYYFDKNRIVSIEPTDAELVHLTIAGDEAAFSVLASRYRGRAFATAARFARGRPELEDLTQEIFLKVWKGLASFRADAPFEHWFMTITVRTCYDFLRKNRKRRDNEILTDDTTDFKPRSETSRVQEQREAWEIVRRLLEKLNEKDRTVIILLELEERSVKEIAKLTGWSESNVKVRAHRARKKMKNFYEIENQA